MTYREFKYLHKFTHMDIVLEEGVLVDERLNELELFSLDDTGKILKPY